MSTSGYGLVLVGGVLVLLVVGGVTTGLVGNTGETGPTLASESPGGGNALAVTGVESPSEVRPGDSLRVRVRVENTGDREITESLTLRVRDDDGAVSETGATVELGPGESTATTIVVDTEVLEPGQYTYEVSSGANSTATGAVAVLHPPAFSLSDESSGLTVVKGTAATLTANVTNTGDYRGLQRVHFAVDRDRDGSVSSTETTEKRVLSIAGGQQQTVEERVETGDLEPGRYRYRIASENESVNGTLTVQQPATFDVQNASAPAAVRRGDPVTVSATLENVGDVGGTTTVEFSGPNGTEPTTRTVTLARDESTNVSFTATTANVSRDTHNYTISTETDAATNAVRVEDSYFEVSHLDGPSVLYVGDTAVFSARVTNVGNVTGTQTVEHRIDSDGDDRPEAYGVEESVTLKPGEQTTVRFELEYTLLDGKDYPVEPLKLETYVYGIYSADTRASSALSVKPAWASGGGGGSSGESDDRSVSNGEKASLDEITQDKYGYYYHEVSGETQRQVREIYDRQPFADGLVAVEVRTREQIARQDYGADIEPGEEFDFTALDIETQQQVEAEFDAQFQSESGDRIESWDEIAQTEYGTTYENLTASRQSSVRAEYQEQFD
ncbi:CARDB domain-containing protein (plasmid) [Haloarcula salina]|uniref:CARDB domain-containing protein n=1 Tax=Haloarcula salina TaxID=1429914 RepID=UPI003C6F772A